MILSFEGLPVRGNFPWFFRRFLQSGDIGSGLVSFICFGSKNLKSSFDMVSLFLCLFFARYRKVVSRSAFGSWTFPVFYSICGLFSMNHSRPKLISEDSKFMAKSFSKNFLLSIFTWTHVNFVI